jgi:putative two-component system response regulator
MNERPNVLIVDDQEANRELLQEQMHALGYEPMLAVDGVAALVQMQQERPDIVLLDIMMPKMNGFQVLERMKADAAMRQIPVIVISAMDDIESVSRCIRLGADDYLAKPFNLTLLQARLSSSLEKKRLLDRQEAYQHEIEEHNASLERRVREQVREITKIQLSAIFAMSKLAESRDPATGEHLERMREYCRVLSEHLAGRPEYAGTIDAAFLENFYHASPLHDIGKVGIPDRILLKPGKLAREEFDVMKRHTTIGAETLRAIEQKHPGNTFIRMGVEVAYSHHEKWDGSGYPAGFRETDIPLVGRILAVGDVYDALTSKRCYKEAFSHEESAQIILEGRSSHFDPVVIDAFVGCEDAFAKIRLGIANSEKRIEP